MAQNSAIIVVAGILVLLCIWFSKRKQASKCVVSMLCALSVLGSGICPLFLAGSANAETDTNYCEQCFEVHPNNSGAEDTVTLNGVMPKKAKAEVTDVTESFDALAQQENTENHVLAAYDITIMNGNREYQPNENNPVLVEIANAEIKKENVSVLWHIKDDGTKEEITDFTAEDGKVRFYAKGFSVYAIVDVPLPASSKMDQATEVSELVSERGLRTGFYVYYGYGNYFTDTIISANSGGNVNDGVIAVDDDLEMAGVWYFEEVEKDGNTCYRMYTKIDDVRKYLYTTGTNQNNNVGLTEDVTRADILKIASANNHQNYPNSFCIKKYDTTDKYLQYSTGGHGIRYYSSSLNNGRVTNINMIIRFDFADAPALPRDYYRLNGKSYGLMNYTGLTMGDALMVPVEQESNYLDLMTMFVKEDTQVKTLYVSQDSDISLWTFQLLPNTVNQYYIFNEKDSVVRYLKFNGNQLETTTNFADATVIDVVSNRNNKVRLTAGDYSISFHADNDNHKKFILEETDANDKDQWLNLVTVSELTENDYVTYTAEKVGVSDASVTNGSSGILYTRVWNNENKAYDFYALNYDGTLFPCYERGDHIMWLGHKTNILLWTFTEHYNYDGSRSFRYDLYSPYGNHYLSPQVENEQIFSDTRAFINLPGRRDGEYYTSIIQWDEKQYAYTGLGVITVPDPVTGGEYKKVIPVSRNQASTFYFAQIERGTPKLTEIKTIDNNQYNIQMKMVDFEGSIQHLGWQQNEFLNTRQESNDKWADKGLLSTDLKENGYPDTTRRTDGQKSLQELFNHDASKVTDVNHLFVESTYNSSGYFEFDSCQNFATLLQSDGSIGNNFTVYKELGTAQGNKTTMKHGQFFPYNTITPGIYSTDNPQNLYGALAMPGEPKTALLPESDPRKHEKLHQVTDHNGQIVSRANYHFGVELTTSFVQSPNGKDAWEHDIVFEFTGDDDFWFYVDNELIIDLGGVHSALGGNVNFATGQVTVGGFQDPAHPNDKSKEVVKTFTLREIFANNYKERNPKQADETDEQFTARVNQHLSKYFDEGKTVFKDFTTHQMRIFYMERGAGASNLHMRFNLNYLKPGHVLMRKELDGTETPDFNLVEYPYQIFYTVEVPNEQGSTTSEERQLTRMIDNGGVTYQNSSQTVDYRDTYIPPDCTTQYKDVYFIRPGRDVEIAFPPAATAYRIVECGVNEHVYQDVLINHSGGLTASQIDNSSRYDYTSQCILIGNGPTAVFTNKISLDALRTLSFKKFLYDEEDRLLTEEEDGTTFKFRLYLSNGAEDTLRLARFHDYYVKSPNGKICRWDISIQKLVETDKTDYATLTDEEKEQLTFETSSEGEISRIPTGYTVKVPNIPRATKFKVEERELEIPNGYHLKGYECAKDGTTPTYKVESESTPNVGWITDAAEPFVNISNKRGIGLEALKKWSDKDFASSHDTIYTAVYLKEGNGNNITYRLLPDSVKQIKHPDTAVRYFFDRLQTGKTIADYYIFEVEVTDPVLDNNGNLVSYDDSKVKRLNENDVTEISAKSRITQNVQTYEYVVSYEMGEPRNSTPNIESGNVRTDIITDTRKEGINIALYEMNAENNHDVPLADGDFTLTKGEELLGYFTSDETGKVTIFYDFEVDAEYTLTETLTPNGYVGLPQAVKFKIHDENDTAGNRIRKLVITSGNDSSNVVGNWEVATNHPDQTIIATLDIFNMPFRLTAKKVDGISGAPLPGAVFALYRSVVGFSGEVKDFYPMEDYEELVCDQNGIIPKIDSSLPKGRYYLNEVSAPDGYIKHDEDIIFRITDKGEVYIDSKHQNYLQLITDENRYVITIPDAHSNVLTLTHKVNADNVNKALKLETMGVANKDVFEVQMGTRYMYSGGENPVEVPRTQNFTRKSPNTTYIQNNPDYADQTPITSYTKKTDIIQQARELVEWNPKPSEKKNNCSIDAQDYTPIQAYYEWSDTSQQLDRNGEKYSTPVMSATNKGTGVPQTDGTVALLYDQTATFINQFPSIICKAIEHDECDEKPLLKFQLKSNLQAFKSVNDATTGIAQLYHNIVEGEEEKTPLERKHNQFYTATVDIEGMTFNKQLRSTYDVVDRYGGGEFTLDGQQYPVDEQGNITVVDENMSITYEHTIKTGSVTISKKLDGVVSDKDTQEKKKAYTFRIAYRNLFGYHNPDSSIDEEPWTYADGLYGTLSGKDENDRDYTTDNNIVSATGGQFTLVAGSSVTFDGIPVGTILRVEEISEFIGSGDERMESRVSQVIFSGVVCEGNLAEENQKDYTGENSKTDLFLDTQTVQDGDDTRTKVIINTGTYQMTDNADWLYEVHNTYGATPVLYRYIDRHIVNGKPTDLRDNYTYFTKNVTVNYDDINSDGTLKANAKTSICDSAPKIMNVLCNYDITYNAESNTDGIYYVNQNTFYRNSITQPSSDEEKKSQFSLCDVTEELETLLDAMCSQNSATNYAMLKDDCKSFKSPQVQGYAKNDVIGLKQALKSIVDETVSAKGITLKQEALEALYTALKEVFYYRNDHFYIVMATYANTLRQYDVDIQLVVPNALNPTTKAFSEQREINIDSVVHKTGDYVHIRYKVPFNGITNLSNTNHADGGLNIGIINALNLSANCKELYHITTAENRELYFGYWERVVSYHDGNSTQTTYTPVSTNFNYHYRVNDHVTIRAVYQEARKGGTETDDNRKRYAPGVEFGNEEDFVPFDTDKNRTIERLYTPLQKRTRTIYWEEENGVRKYKDIYNQYTIPEEKITGLKNYDDRFYQETYDAKYGKDVVKILIDVEQDWHDVALNDTGSYLTVNGTTTESYSVDEERELYQVSYMVPNEREQVGYSASATDRTYNTYSVQTEDGVQERTRVDIVFGGVGSADSDTNIEQVGYVLFQSPKDDNANYGNASAFREAILNDTALREKLYNVSDTAENDRTGSDSIKDFQGGYNVKMNMTKVTMHTGTAETDTSGVVLTNKNRVNIVFDIPNNESTRKSFFTCYTVMKMKIKGEDNSEHSFYRVSPTPATFNLREADIVTENEHKKTYFIDTESVTNGNYVYLSSNHITATEGRRLIFTPHFLEHMDDNGEYYTGTISRVEVGKTELTAEQITQLNDRKDIEFVFDPSVYLNDPISENTLTVKVYADKLRKNHT